MSISSPFHSPFLRKSFWCTNVLVYVPLCFLLPTSTPPSDLQWWTWKNNPSEILSWHGKGWKLKLMVLCFCMHPWLPPKWDELCLSGAGHPFPASITFSPSGQAPEIPSGTWVGESGNKTENMEVDWVNEGGKERRDNYICHFSHRFPRCS